MFRRAPSFWMIALLALSVAALYLGFNTFKLLAASPPHLDSASYYAAAQATFLGLTSPYNPAVLQTFKPPELVVIYPYLYPPPSLFLLRPLAGMSFPEVFKASLILNDVLLAGLAVGLCLWVLSLTRSLLAAVLTLVLLMERSPGLLATLWYGQINALIAVLLLLGLIGLVKGRPALGGVALGIAMMIKVYPLILLPWLLIRREMNALAAALLTLVLLVAASWIWLPHYLWADWLAHVVQQGYGAQPDGLISAAHPTNMSLHGLFMRSFSAEAAKLLSYGATALLLTVSYLAALKRPEPLPAHFFALLWLTLLIAPLTWLSHTVYTLPAVLYFAAEAWRAKKWAWLSVFIALYAGLVPYALSEQTIPLWRTNLAPLGLFLLWGMMQQQIIAADHKAKPA